MSNRPHPRPERAEERMNSFPDECTSVDPRLGHPFDAPSDGPGASTNELARMIESDLADIRSGDLAVARDPLDAYAGPGRDDWAHHAATLALDRVEALLAVQQRAGERRAEALAQHLHVVGVEVAAMHRALLWVGAFVIVLGLGLALQRAWPALTFLLTG